MFVNINSNYFIIPAGEVEKNNMQHLQHSYIAVEYKRAVFFLHYVIKNPGNSFKSFKHCIYIEIKV